jgi:hypothetical protein
LHIYDLQVVENGGEAGKTRQKRARNVAQRSNSQRLGRRLSVANQAEFTSCK